MNKNKKAFTMVEMVVTLLIIITLSLLSFPIYRGRVNKTSKLAEGYALLGTIISAQISYFNEYRNFLGSAHLNLNGDVSFTANDPVLGINAMNNRYFTWFNSYGHSGLRGGSKYYFIATVRSKDAGTISLEYNKTQRFEPVVSGI